MNILILSCGIRNKIVQYFKNALKGTGMVVATDCSPLAPALYEADRYYLVPKMTDEGYLDVILGICRKENITGVLSLIDPELSLLAANADKFKELGTTVIGSSYALCELALDKLSMFQWLTSHSYPCARSYVDKETFFRDVEDGKISYPVFVKPVKGSASLAISKVDNRETIEMLFTNSNDLMIQEFLDGQEFGADIYIDMISGEVVSVFVKKKLKMRAGETDKAVSFKDEALFDLIVRFAEESGYRGQIDIDIFNVGGVYYISEVNPRFGGGYPFAYETGCDHIAMILKNLNGEVNKKQIGTYEENVYTMKYSEIMVKKEEKHE